MCVWVWDRAKTLSQVNVRLWEQWRFLPTSALIHKEGSAADTVSNRSSAVIQIKSRIRFAGAKKNQSFLVGALLLKRIKPPASRDRDQIRKQISLRSLNFPKVNISKTSRRQQRQVFADMILRIWFEQDNAKDACALKNIQTCRNRRITLTCLPKRFRRPNYCHKTLRLEKQPSSQLPPPPRRNRRSSVRLKPLARAAAADTSANTSKTSPPD